MKSKKLIQPIIFVLLTVLLFSSLFYVVSASGGFVTQNSVQTIWYDYDKSIDANLSDTYPYNDIYVDSNKNSHPIPSSAISRVAFDIVYGVRRKLVSYTGEIPYDIAYDDDHVQDGFDGLPYNNDGYRGPKTSITYWGADLSTLAPNGTIEEVEAINKDSVVSLRLYALQNASSHGFLSGFSNLFYTVIQFFTWLFSLLVKLVIVIKNINMTTIMDALNLQELGKVIYELFIAHDNAAGTRILSPLAIICMVVFLFTVVGYVLSYVKGQKKEKNLWTDILIVALVGVILVGVGRGNHVLSLGNGVSDLTNAVVNEFTATTTGARLWQTSTTDSGSYKANQSTNTMYNEISLVNKILIDLQITNQFGVDSIADLSYSSLGDSGGSIANETLWYYHLDPAGQKDETVTSSKDTLYDATGGNLGYYFWFASSPAKNMPANNKTLPESSFNQPQKLSNMITYLQKVYNHTSSQANRDQILNIIRHFASPSIWGGTLLMLILQAIYILLALCLAKYALKVVTGKLSMFAGILAIPIGGALIASTKPQLVKYGKGILGILVMSFIRIVIFGLFFDVILYTVGALLSTDFLRLLVVLLLLIVFMKFHKAIDLAIEKALANVERTIAPQAREFKAAAKSFARRKVSEAKAWNAERGKIVGYDENGNPIREKSRGKLLDTMLTATDNALTNDFNTHKSFSKISREQRKAREEEHNAAMSQINEAADKVKRKQAEKDQANVDSILNEIEQDKQDQIGEIYDAETQTYQVDQLTDEERAMYDQINNQERELNNLAGDDTYARLRRKKANGLLKPKEQEIYDRYVEQEAKLEAERDATKTKLQASIKDRVTASVNEEHREELEAAITAAMASKQELIDTSGVNSNNKKEKTANTLKTSDFEDQMLLEKQLEQVKSGEIVSRRLTQEERVQAQEAHEQYLVDNAVEKHGKIKKQREATEDRTLKNQEILLDAQDERINGPKANKTAQKKTNTTSSSTGSADAGQSDEHPEEHVDKDHAEAVLAAGAAVVAGTKVSTAEQPKTEVHELTDVENDQASDSTGQSTSNAEPKKLKLNPKGTTTEATKPVKSADASKVVHTGEAGDLNGQSIQIGGSALDENEAKRLREQQVREAQRNAAMNKSNNRPASTTTASEARPTTEKAGPITDSSEDTRTETTKRIEEEAARRKAEKQASNNRTTTAQSTSRPAERTEASSRGSATPKANNKQVEVNTASEQPKTINLNLNNRSKPTTESTSRPAASTSEQTPAQDTSTARNSSSTRRGTTSSTPSQPKKTETKKTETKKTETVSTQASSGDDSKARGKKLAETIAKKREASGQTKPKQSEKPKKKPEAQPQKKKPEKQAGVLNGSELPTGGSAVEIDGVTYTEAQDILKDIKSSKGGVVEEARPVDSDLDTDVSKKSNTQSTIEDFDASSFLDEE